MFQSATLQRHLPLTACGIALALSVLPVSAAPDVSQLFQGAPPQVVVHQGNAKLADEDGESLPCFLSVEERIAVTVGFIHESDSFVYGELLIWDLAEGRLRHRVKLPARVAAMGGIRGSGTLVAVGGPRGKDFNEPFVNLIDLRQGKVVAEFSPQHESSADISLRLSGDNRFAAVRDGNYYNLNTEAKEVRITNYRFPVSGGSPAAPQTANQQTWNQLAPPSSESAGNAGGIPNWINRVGDTDAGFALSENEQGTALWRMDTWERVARMGEFSPPWQDWVPSQDGRHLVSWRDDLEGGLTVWDLATFRVTSFDEPGFHRGISPCFSADNRFLRYGRIASAPNAVEIISRELSTGKNTVAQRIPAKSFQNYYENEFHAVFSSNGEHLLVTPETGKDPLLLSWDGQGTASVSRPAAKGEIPLFVSDDGGTGSFTGNSFENDDVVAYPLSVFNLKSGRKIGDWSASTVGHPPRFSGAIDPVSGRSAFSQHTTGASLGYYNGDAVVMRNGSISPIPGFKVGGDLEPTDRNGNAWSVGFITPPGSRSSLLGVYANIGRFVTFDPENQRIVHDFQWADYNRFVYDRDDGYPLMKNVIASSGGRAFLPQRDGGIRVVDFETNGNITHRADLWSLPGNGWFAVTPEGYYACSVGSERHVFFRLGESIHPFDQFDAFLNRPDVVGTALGTDGSEVEALRLACERRLESLSLKNATASLDSSSMPLIEFGGLAPLVHDGETISVPVSGNAPPSGKIDRLEIFANGVRLDLPETDSLLGKSSFSQVIAIPLAPGENFLQFSLIDKRGNRSIAIGSRVHRKAGNEKPDLYVLTVGVSDYANDDYDLTFASKDARDLGIAFEESAVGFGNIYRKEVLDTEATRKGIKNGASFFQASKPGDRAIVFLAGHGLLDEKYRYFFGTTDIDAAEPFRRGMSFKMIESLFNGVAARERLVLMDTCQAGGVDVALLKSIESEQSGIADGVRAISNENLRAAAAITPETAIKGQRFVEELFTDLNRGIGATVISASGGLEFAVESADWNNGVFTFATIDALRNSGKGDRNKDGILSASELVDTVSENVVALTGGLQHPNTRSVNLAVDFPIVGREQVVREEQPTDFLKRYLRMSSANVEQPATPTNQVLALFAERVDYFGKPLSHSAIFTDIEEYGKRFDERFYNLQGPVRVSASSDGRNATLDYKMTFRAGFFEDAIVNIPGRGPTQSKRRAYRNGEMNMQLKIIKQGSEWKIVALKTN